MKIKIFEVEYYGSNHVIENRINRALFKYDIIKIIHITRRMNNDGFEYLEIIGEVKNG